MGAGESFDIPPAATLAAQYEAARPAREESAARARKAAEDKERLYFENIDRQMKERDVAHNEENMDIILRAFTTFTQRPCPCVRVRLHSSSNKDKLIDELKKQQYEVTLSRDDGLDICLPGVK